MSKNSRRNVRGVTVNKTVRIEDELWQEFGDALALVGGTRAEEIRNTIRWQLGLPDAVAPRRLINPKDRPR